MLHTHAHAHTQCSALSLFIRLLQVTGITKTLDELRALTSDVTQVGRSAGTMRDVLLQLQSRPTFEEQWPDQYQAGLAKGKARVLKLESIRTAPTDMATILSARPDVKQWWDQIGTN